MRFVRCLSLIAALATTAVASAQDKWVTIKGQVKLTKLPEHIKENVAVEVNTDKQHCTSKGPVTKKNITRSKDGGFENVIVYLRPDNETRGSEITKEMIHPDLQSVKPKNHIIDQPCCQFEPRVTLARVGDTLEVKNSSPVNHNFAFDSSANGNANPNIPPGQSYKLPNPLKYEPRYFKFACSVHPWMGGVVQVFDHPYFAVTDKDGKFEIKNAPAGKFRIVYYHEEGYHKGAPGRFGTPITIEGQGGTMELKPQEYEFIPPKN